jgi:hypothetical protein
MGAEENASVAQNAGKAFKMYSCFGKFSVQMRQKLLRQKN